MVNHDKWSHLERARKLLSTGDDDALRYACLELRFCIEAIELPGRWFLRCITPEGSSLWRRERDFSRRVGAS
jgi:hypothetical protein